MNLEENLSPSQIHLRKEMRSDQLIGRRYRFCNGGLSHRFSGITDDVVVGTGSLVKENCSGPVAENQCSEKMSEDRSGSDALGVSKKGPWVLEWYKTYPWPEPDSPAGERGKGRRSASCGEGGEARRGTTGYGWAPRKTRAVRIISGFSLGILWVSRRVGGSPVKKTSLSWNTI